MRKSILIAYFLISCLLVYSQEHTINLGFSGGTTFSNIKAVNYLPGDYSYRMGGAGELSIKMNFRTHMFVMSDIGILQKGYRFKDESTLNTGSSDLKNSYSGIEMDVSHSYLNNSWFIGYQFGNKISVSINAGAYYSFYLGSKIEDWNYIYVDPVDHEIIGDPAIPVGYHENKFTNTDRNQNVSNWDLGITGSIGLGYWPNPKYAIRLTGKYNQGLIDTSLIELFDPTEMRNRTFTLLIGVGLKL